MRKFWLSLLTVSALTLVFFTTTAFTNASNVSAKVQLPANSPCILQSQDGGVTMMGPENSIVAYNNSGSDAPLHLGGSGTISNTLTSEIGFDAKVVSGKVGFSVEASNTVSYDYTITIPTGHKGEIDAYGDFQSYLLTNSCSGQQAVAYEFLNIEYNSYIN